MTHHTSATMEASILGAQEFECAECGSKLRPGSVSFEERPPTEGSLSIVLRRTVALCPMCADPRR